MLDKQFHKYHFIVDVFGNWPFYIRHSHLSPSAFSFTERNRSRVSRNQTFDMSSVSSVSLYRNIFKRRIHSILKILFRPFFSQIVAKPLPPFCNPQRKCLYVPRNLWRAIHNKTLDNFPGSCSHPPTMSPISAISNVIFGTCQEPQEPPMSSYVWSLLAHYAFSKKKNS